jgi:antitoxin VapB
MGETAMQLTKAFKNGNSQAVRIPAELAYDSTDVELEIERVGEEIRIRPVRKSLAGVMDVFARFSPGLMRDGRENHEQSERDEI